ncbi:unnamed protein product, partial [Adineta steineri]
MTTKYPVFSFYLPKVNLLNAVFHHLWLENCDFTSANLESSNFDRSVIAKSYFNNANLQSASFNDSRLVKVNFNGAFMQESRLTTKWSFSTVDFTSANLTNATVGSIYQLLDAFSIDSTVFPNGRQEDGTGNKSETLHFKTITTGVTPFPGTVKRIFAENIAKVDPNGDGMIIK